MLEWAERLYIWWIARRISRRWKKPYTLVRAIVENELLSIPGTIEGQLEYQTTEQDILEKRLIRRYDPGLALQEAINRASVQKAKLLAEQAGMGLTPKQLAALEFSKSHAKRRV